jgi:hypothetical protein
MNILTLYKKFLNIIFLQNKILIFGFNQENSRDLEKWNSILQNNYYNRVICNRLSSVFNIRNFISTKDCIGISGENSFWQNLFNWTDEDKRCTTIDKTDYSQFTPYFSWCSPSFWIKMKTLDKFKLIVFDTNTIEYVIHITSTTPTNNYIDFTNLYNCFDIIYDEGVVIVPDYSMTNLYNSILLSEHLKMCALSNNIFYKLVKTIPGLNFNINNYIIFYKRENKNIKVLNFDDNFHIYFLMCFFYNY